MPPRVKRVIKRKGSLSAQAKAPPLGYFLVSRDAWRRTKSSSSRRGKRREPLPTPEMTAPTIYWSATFCAPTSYRSGSWPSIWWMRRSCERSRESHTKRTAKNEKRRPAWGLRIAFARGPKTGTRKRWIGYRGRWPFQGCLPDRPLARPGGRSRQRQDTRRVGHVQTPTFGPSGRSSRGERRSPGSSAVRPEDKIRECNSSANRYLGRRSRRGRLPQEAMRQRITKRSHEDDASRGCKVASFVL
jgi:hypothetical protein